MPSMTSDTTAKASLKHKAGSFIARLAGFESTINELTEKYEKEREARLALKEKVSALASIRSEYRTLQNKYNDTLKEKVGAFKKEREARQKLKEHLVKTKTELETIQSEYRVLQRKYIELLRSGGQSAKPGGGDAEWNDLIAIAESKVDSDEIKAKIEAYHASFEKKAYDHVWVERVTAILNVLETGERDLSRVLAKVRRNEERSRSMGLGNRRWVINDEYMELPWRPAAAAYRSAVFEAVHDQIRQDTTKIIETGSGWGEHLSNIHLEGGPLDATYYALEMEEEGRKCSMLLSALDPAFHMESHFFDYRNPDYSMLPKDDQHAILLTAHSVEQVGEIHENCILDALQLGKRVTGIHFEPIGWQTYPESEWSEATKEHHARCMEKDYNQNLWPLLNRLQDEGRIKILDMKTNFIGLDYNPATYILWEKV